MQVRRVPPAVAPTMITVLSALLDPSSVVGIVVVGITGAAGKPPSETVMPLTATPASPGITEIAAVKSVV